MEKVKDKTSYERLIKLKEKLEAEIEGKGNTEKLKLLLKGIKWKIMMSEFQNAIDYNYKSKSLLNEEAIRWL